MDSKDFSKRESKDKQGIEKKKKRTKDDSVLLSELGAISSDAEEGTDEESVSQKPSQTRRPRIWRPWEKRDRRVKSIGRFPSRSQGEEESNRSAPLSEDDLSRRLTKSKAPPRPRFTLARKKTVRSPHDRVKTSFAQPAHPHHKPTVPWLTEEELTYFKQMSIDSRFSNLSDLEETGDSLGGETQEKEIEKKVCKCIPYRIMILILCILTIIIDVVFVYHATVHFKNARPSESAAMGRVLQTVACLDAFITTGGIIGTLIRKGALLGPWVYSRLPFALVWTMCALLLTPSRISVGMIIFIIVVVLCVLITLTCYIEIIGYRYLEILYGVYDHNRFNPDTQNDLFDENSMMKLSKTSSKGKSRNEDFEGNTDKQIGDADHFDPNKRKPSDKKEEGDREIVVDNNKSEGDKFFSSRAMDPKPSHERDVLGTIIETSDDQSTGLEKESEAKLEEVSDTKKSASSGDQEEAAHKRRKDQKTKARGIEKKPRSFKSKDHAKGDRKHENSKPVGMEKKKSEKGKAEVQKRS